LTSGLLLKQAFSKSCKAESWACESCTGDPSFSGVWHSVFGFGLLGAKGKVDYGPTGPGVIGFPHPPTPPDTGMGIDPPGGGGGPAPIPPKKPPSGKKQVFSR
jgi:hypothetical protein